MGRYCIFSVAVPAGLSIIMISTVFAQSVCLLDKLCDTGPPSLVQA